MRNFLLKSHPPLRTTLCGIFFIDKSRPRTTLFLLQITAPLTLLISHVHNPLLRFAVVHTNLHLIITLPTTRKSLVHIYTAPLPYIFIGLVIVSRGAYSFLYITFAAMAQLPPSIIFTYSTSPPRVPLFLSRFPKHTPLHLICHFTSLAA